MPADSPFHNQGDGSFLKMPDDPLTLRAGSSTVSAVGDGDGDGTFEQVEVGDLVTDGIRRQPPVWGDDDNKGFLDLMVPCGDFVVLPDVQPQRCQLYGNHGSGNHRLKVKLAGTASGSNGVASRTRSTRCSLPWP